MEGQIGLHIPLSSLIPFLGILLSIALLPLVNHHFWHQHFGKIAMLWSLLSMIPFLLNFPQEAFHHILHVFLLDYIPFIILLWGLYTATGGIAIKGVLIGTPTVNLLLLIIGTLLASLIGTTGASVLLVRVLLRANAVRRWRTHQVVFFIFLVCNIGGSLTPLGDPPLFLGFLHGVPFFWTFNLLPQMGFLCLSLLVLFYIIDRSYWQAESQELIAIHYKAMLPKDGSPQTKLHIKGGYNLFFLAGIIGAVLLSGIWQPGHQIHLFGIELAVQNLLRDSLILLMGFLSLRFTPWSLREDNGFTWFPIKEVGYLFAGIFTTIVPVLLILQAGQAGALGLVVGAADGEVAYFWICGLLSSFLDNAPTYLTFFTLALGKLGLDEATIRQALRMPPAHWAALGPTPESIAQFIGYLKAISLGAVLMGALTYIGNAPNFMVRTIAEDYGVAMPSFFGYMLWSFLGLLPLYGVMAWVFF